MQIAILGAGRVGSTLGRLWHAVGHDVTFAARARRPAAGTGGGTRGARTCGLGRRRRGGRRRGARGCPGPCRDRRAAGGRPARRPCHDRRGQLLRAATGDTAVAGRCVPAGALGACLQLALGDIMADDNHRNPPWVMFLSGAEEAKPVVAQLIRDAGFDPFDLGGIDDSRLQDPGSALWLSILTHDEATALIAQDKVRGHGRGRSVGAADASARAGRAVRESSATAHRTIPRSSSSTCRARFSRPGSAGASSRPSGTASGRRSTASTRRRSPRCRPPRSRQ